MIYVVWAYYYLLGLIYVLLSGLGGLVIVELIIRLIDTIKNYRYSQSQKRRRIAWEKEMQKELEEYERKETERRLHEIEKEEWPLFFWKEELKDGDS